MTECPLELLVEHRTFLELDPCELHGGVEMRARGFIQDLAIGWLGFWEWRQERFGGVVVHSQLLPAAMALICSPVNGASSLTMARIIL